MTRVKLLLVTLVLTLGPASVARSQVTIDVAKITCDQMLLFKVTDPDNIAMWLSGYYHAKQDTTVVEVQQMKVVVDKVKTFCRQNPDATVMRAVDAVVEPKKIRSQQ
jgi:acid stress chaperone HdeB